MLKWFGLWLGGRLCIGLSETKNLTTWDTEGHRERCRGESSRRRGTRPHTGIGERFTRMRFCSARCSQCPASLLFLAFGLFG